ncbi:DUF192 domain-containing protein [Acidiferrimicrobium sp. IK]|uniref:DUF192 domain-containing protein n=1 Tax=Acidiferrimicrobium sp. IK TaxID=2871700 RepID=UPI0021CB7DC3|nr:DUF192 domain-containing protein [Acidiferrimicrobium sp. IK]MCU4187118.1 DUF192 domain-containing protein [Acidiferrimicrobium sp. IK]
MPDWNLDPSSPRLLGAVRRAAWVVLAAGVVGFFAVGSGTAARATLVAPDATVPAGDVPGFEQISFTVTPGPGLPTTFRASCALLASTAAQRDRGLMGRSSLGRYAGMLFRFPGPSTEVFYMYETPMPLSIAWFDAGGRWVGERDLVPCPSRAAGGCPHYSAPQPYSSALEVPKGTLHALGIGPGSVIHAGGPCIG